MFTFGGGFGALGYYISQEVKYSNYVETTATVVSHVAHGDDTYCVYRFEVDGTVYEVQGGVANGGSSVPKIGDTATIKYNPENPMDFRIGTEGRFFLAFGSIALYIGLVVVLYFIQSRGWLKLQFFLAFVMIGITVIAVLASLVAYEPHGVIQYLSDNFIIHRIQREEKITRTVTTERVLYFDWLFVAIAYRQIRLFQGIFQPFRSVFLCRDL